ncbi:MAG: EF-hand domain-containing protein [Planctomycetes bacterium]|nr:EF-hand domain-containing protein [Planctomycetota bacterium]MCH9776405.1 EF-hand domain-containing protein [Planctomycetota bacterium]MCH9789993.1 EF-hand domain-containing protein [Planctomycetota bacterium]
MQRLVQFMTVMLILFFSVHALFAEPDEGKSKPQNIFQQLDKNSDGIITADEVPEGKDRFFDHLIRSSDKNKDGKLTQDEFQSGVKKEEQKFPAGEGPNRNRDPRAFQMMLKRLDKNGDQKISKEELPEPLRNRLEPLFERLNKEEISIEEFGRYVSKFRGKPDGGKKEGNPQPQEKRKIEGAERFFSTLDTNKDGKLTIDEAPERGKQILRRILERAGKDQDAELSKKEFMETMMTFRPGRRPEGRDGDKAKKQSAGDRDKNRGEKSTRNRPVPALMKVLDTNRDGRLSKDELQKIGQVFDQLDQNKDGSLDLSEMFMRRDQGGNASRFRGEQGRNRSKSENKKSDAKNKDSE